MECDGCGSQPVDGTLTVSCDGTDFTPPPSSVGGDGGTPSPAAGVSDLSSSAGSRTLVRDAWRETSALVALVAAVVALVV